MGKLGIYVQVPFCQTKCTYCNFHTGVVAGARFAPYVEAVCREIREHERLLRAAGVDWAGRWGRGNACPSGRRAAPLQREVQPNKAIQREKKQHNDELKVGSCEGGRAEARPYRRPQGEPASEGSSYSRREEFVVDTVYIGGGTPSLLDAGHLRRILEEIGEKFGGEGGEIGKGTGQRRDAENAEIRGERGYEEEAGCPEARLYEEGKRDAPFVPQGKLKRVPTGAEPCGGREERFASEGGPYESVTEFEEVTLEADPETVTVEKAEAWVATGINRVSFGVQSFSDKELAAAGRMHRREDIYRAARILRKSGIRNLSFDLIAGLPHQTRESWERSLEELAALEPEHVSVYLLEVDEGSRLGKELLAGGTRYSAPVVPSDDEMAEFYETAQERLGAAGYEQYEISNWAKAGFASKHNLKYWRREPYLGFGAGAHSFSGTERWANAHDAAAYVRGIESGILAVEQNERVTAQQALEEKLFLGLRQLEGIDVGRIEREYGVRLEERMAALARAGLVEREGDVVRLAKKRLSVSNEVFVELMK